MNNQKPLSSSMRRFLFVITQKETKDKIAEFRDFWRIIPEGFKNKKEYYQWLDKIISDPPTVLKQETLKGEITPYTITGKTIRKFKIKKIPPRAKIEATRQKLFNDTFQRAIDELGCEIKMDNNWSKLFYDYLLWGPKKLILDSEPGITICKITEYYEKEKPTKEHFEMIIDPNTTKNEILSVYKRFIGPEKEKMVGFIKPPSHKKIIKPDW